MAHERRSVIVALALNAHFESFVSLEKGFACHSDASYAPVCGRWYGMRPSLQVDDAGVRNLFLDWGSIHLAHGYSKTQNRHLVPSRIDGPLHEAGRSSKGACGTLVRGHPYEKPLPPRWAVGVREVGRIGSRD